MTTTRCFLLDMRKEKELSEKVKLITRKGFVKIPIINRSRAYAYAHTLQGVMSFCCHKCHRAFVNSYISDD